MEVNEASGAEQIRAPNNELQAPTLGEMPATSSPFTNSTVAVELASEARVYTNGGDNEGERTEEEGARANRDSVPNMSQETAGSLTASAVVAASKLDPGASLHDADAMHTGAGRCETGVLSYATHGQSDGEGVLAAAEFTAFTFAKESCTESAAAEDGTS